MSYRVSLLSVRNARAEFSSYCGVLCESFYKKIKKNSVTTRVRTVRELQLNTNVYCRKFTSASSSTHSCLHSMYVLYYRESSQPNPRLLVGLVEMRSTTDENIPMYVWLEAIMKKNKK